MPESSLFQSPEQAGSELTDPVVTIGNFDGVHVGHRTIFERTIELANASGVPSAALTFSPHPVRFFRPDADEFRLTTDTQKFDLIRACGIDAVVSLQFDGEIADLAPEAFVDRIIERGVGAGHVVVGANFAFGKNRAGSTDDLRRLNGDRGIETTVLEEIELDGEVVSSTRIREELADANVEVAARLLDRNYRLVGRVRRGDGRGRELGFPTANIDAENLVPGDGIYATYLHLPDGRSLPAAASIGARPTFEGAGRAVEAYVLDREDLALYGFRVELEFVSFLRPEREFETSEALVEQMERDVSAVRERLAQSEPGNQ